MPRPFVPVDCCWMSHHCRRDVPSRLPSAVARSVIVLPLCCCCAGPVLAVTRLPSAVARSVIVLLLCCCCAALVLAFTRLPSAACPP